MERKPLKRSSFLSVCGMNFPIDELHSLMFRVGHFAGSTFVTLNARVFISGELSNRGCRPSHYDMAHLDL